MEPGSFQIFPQRGKAGGLFVAIHAQRMGGESDTGWLERPKNKVGRQGCAMQTSLGSRVETHTEIYSFSLLSLLLLSTATPQAGSSISAQTKRCLIVSRPAVPGGAGMCVPADCLPTPGRGSLGFPSTAWAHSAQVQGKHSQGTGNSPRQNTEDAAQQGSAPCTEGSPSVIPGEIDRVPRGELIN